GRTSAGARQKTVGAWLDSRAVKGTMPLGLSLRATRSWILPVVVLLALDASGQQRAAMFHNPPPRVKASGTLRIDGLLVNGQDLKAVYLRFRKPGGEFGELKMTLRYGDLYRAELPTWEL